MLGEICTLEYGKPLKKTQRQDGVYPVLGSNGRIDTHNEFIATGPCIIVGRKGSAGAIVWEEQNCYPIDTTYYVQLKEKIVLKYLYYLLQIQKLVGESQAGGVPGLNRNDVYKISVPVPPLPVQKEIVRILDAFTELEVELEAELEARRKQYEYYRNELLTFDKLGGGGRS